MPEKYGPWKTLHERLRIWTKDGRRGCATGWVEQLAVVDEAIGRSRGGLTSITVAAIVLVGLALTTYMAFAAVHSSSAHQREKARPPLGRHQQART